MSARQMAMIEEIHIGTEPGYHMRAARSAAMHSFASYMRTVMTGGIKGC